VNGSKILHDCDVRISTRGEMITFKDWYQHEKPDNICSNDSERHGAVSDRKHGEERANTLRIICAGRYGGNINLPGGEKGGGGGEKPGDPGRRGTFVHSPKIMHKILHYF